MTGWSWTCPRCGLAMPRSAINAHLDDHDAHPERVIVWVAIAALGWLAAGAIVWLVWSRG